MTRRSARRGERLRLAAAGIACSLLVACASDGAAAPAPSTTSREVATSASTAVAPSTVAPSSTTTLRPTTTAPSAEECVGSMPLQLRAAQVVMPAVLAEDLAFVTPLIARWKVGGVLLLTWPAGSDPAELAALKASTSPPLMIAVDEEGGRVQRLRALGELPSQQVVATSMTPDEAGQMISSHAALVRQLGIDVVFGPVVDVRPVGAQGSIGSRSFGDDPAVVTAYASEYVDAWRSAGILPVLKHFPGHGSASGDSHDGGVVTPSLEQLRPRDLAPYAALVAAGAGVMIGHLDVPGLTDLGPAARPASVNAAAITDLLRDEMGYSDALVFTDALDMDAVLDRWSAPEAAVLSIAAGADVALFSSSADTPAMISAIADAVTSGELPEARLNDAVARIFEHKGLDPCAATS